MLYINSELFAYIAKKLDYHVKARKPHIHIICEMLDIKEKGFRHERVYCFVALER